ncbi:MAG: mRNA surveillance protein pelota [archaeon]|nr:MAG: mRNA surveillance protein pelota [archaeon]
MKILKKELKKGFLTLKMENPDDAWKLEGLLEEGDLVSGRTLRSKEILRGDSKERTGKKPVFLKIKLGKKEFHDYSGRLRLTGEIVEGPEDTIGSYHTFGLEEGTVITIEKEWKKWQLDRIKKSLVRQPKILACVMDEREAVFSEIGEKIKAVAEISNPRAGKQMGETDFRNYFGELISFLKGKSEYYDKIILAGPGFAKEDLQKQIKEREPELSKEIVTETCSHTGETGIQEIIKRGAVERVGRESRISLETKLVEDFLGEIAKDGPVTYGKGETGKAVEMGAVEKLLVSEKDVKENENLMKDAEKHGAEVFVISEEHQSGQKLAKLGGVAAFLRFKV